MRHVLAAVAVVTALLLQLVAVDRFGLPGGPPNLALAVVLVLALLEGPGPGMVYGFAAGLLGDLLSTHALGRLALVWTVAGYLAGLLAPEGRGGERSPLLPIAAVGALSAAATLGYAALDVVVGAAHEASLHIARQAAAVGLYAAALTPFAYLLLRGMLRRLEGSRP